MALRLDALSAPARQLFEALQGAAIWDEFYLAGGTGLALQIGHRLSADFAFFSATNPLGARQREVIRRLLAPFAPVEVEAEEDGTLRLALGDVPISFFRYEYPLVAPLVEHDRVRLASPLDIGLMKLGAVVGRGRKKDFFDLYFLSGEGLSLEAILVAAPRKFSGVRDFPVQAIRALVYFEDAEDEETPRLLRPADWQAVKRYFSEEVSRISRQWFGA